jgi:hypothetical protein
LGHSNKMQHKPRCYIRAPLFHRQQAGAVLGAQTNPCIGVEAIDQYGCC